jgi:hypothetical protein
MDYSSQLRINDLPDWLRHASTRTRDLPSYRLVIPDAKSVDDKRRSEGLNLTIGRHSESGIIEAFGTNNRRDENHGTIVQQILNVGRDEDPREFYEENPGRGTSKQLLHTDFRFWRSRVNGVPVIGPGGKITLFQDRNRVLVDIVVRKRGVVVPSTPRDVTLILESIRREYAGWERYIEIKAEFGYFELSKYQRQRLLRPVYLFVINMAKEDRPVVRWQTARVEFATKVSKTQSRA